MTLPSLLSHTREIVRIMRNRAHPADVVMSEYLRSKKYIGAADRRFISGFAFHTLRLLSVAEAWAKKSGSDDVVMAAYEISIGSLPHSLEGYSATLPQSLSIRWDEHDINDWLKKLPIEVQVCTQRWLLEETHRRWHDDAENVWQAMMAPAPVCLRVNSRRATRDAIVAQLRSENIECEPGLHAPYAIILKHRVNMLQHELYTKGIVEIQDEGSQLVSLACNVAPDMQVLDACAGAGGKTLHLADIMDGKGLIIARDIEWKRLKEIYYRAKRAGVENITVEPPTRNVASVGARNTMFDVVLVDVPCSGMGTVRRMPMPKWRLTQSQLQKIVRKQKLLLEENAAFVKAGGALVYATCSILPTENEDVVADFLSRHNEFYLEYQQQWDPYQHGTDGLFVARMRKG